MVGRDGIKPSPTAYEADALLSVLTARGAPGGNRTRHTRRWRGLSSLRLPSFATGTVSLVPQSRIELAFRPYQGRVLPMYYKGIMYLDEIGGDRGS